MGAEMFYKIFISWISSLLLKNGFVCIRILGEHSFLWHGTPIFNCIFCIQSNFESIFLHVAVFVKIPFQHS